MGVIPVSSFMSIAIFLTSTTNSLEDDINWMKDLRGEGGVNTVFLNVLRLLEEIV